MPIGHRTAQILRHVRSKRGLLILMALGAVLAAILLDEFWATAAYVVAAVASIVVLFVMSMKLSEFHSSIQSLSRDLTTIEHRDHAETLRANRLTAAIRTIHQSVLEAHVEEAQDGHSVIRPLVTVVIPCFNEERFVADAIRSVAQQSFPDWECIIVDDCSTDASLSAIWGVITGDDRFRVLRHKINSGLGASRNTGLRAARGRFITFLDSDDLLMRDSLMDRLMALTDALGDPHVLGSYCGVSVELEEVSLDDLPAHMDWESPRVIDFISSRSECPFNSHAPLLLTETVRKLGGFREEMRQGAEDWDLWYRAMRNGYVFVPSRSRTAVYRQKMRSMVRDLPDGHVAEANRLIGACYENVDPDILWAPSPTPFTEPLYHYQALLHKANRAIRFAAIALLATDRGASRRALEPIHSLTPELVDRHLDIPELVRQGLQRALAIKPDELEQLSNRVSKAAEQIQAIINEISSPPPAIPAVERTRKVQALLVPQHAGQVEPMLQAANDQGFGRDSVAFLSIEREAGDQGAFKEIAGDLKIWSLNEWVLGDMEADLMIVGSMRVGIVDRLAQAMHAAGRKVVEVPQRHAETMHIEEAHREELGRAPAIFSSGVADAFLGIRSLAGAALDDDPAASWKVEEFPETTVDSDAIARLKDQHRGERVVIIGNGPSLNECDLTLLKNEYTIAVNGIFYAADRMGFDPTYYVVEDTAVMRDNLEAIREYVAGHKFFPSIYRTLVGEQANVSYFMMNRGFYEPRSPDFCIPRFSLDPAQRIYSGQSVTAINLQLAYHLGFEEVVLIGMDFSYSIPKDAIVEGDLITSAGADPNHFHPDYFGKGKVWKDPKLDRVLANYALAKEVYEADSRRIVNATVGGRLELFDRVNYNEYFK